MKISDKIRQQRRLKDIKQDELGKRTGVSLKTVQRWESGERSPRMEEIIRLSEALSVPLSYFIETQDEEQKLLPITEHKENLAVDEKASLERNPKMATFTSKNGEHFEAPATPEGYAFLERMLAISMGLPTTASAIG